MAQSNAERQAAYRARLRDANETHQMNLHLGHEAWLRLQELQKRDGVTAAAVIEALLRDALPVVEVIPKAAAPTAQAKLEAKGQERLF